MAKRGRPKINIDWTQFEKLCALQCTLREISDFFNVSEDTIENKCKEHYKMNFSDVFSKKRSRGLISLRRSQFRLAEKNATMSIFLGKNYLGQSDMGLIGQDSKDDEISFEGWK